MVSLTNLSPSEPMNRNRLRTVLEEIVFGKTLFTLVVISVKLCRVRFHTMPKSSCHRGHQFFLVDHVVHFHNFHAD